MPWWGGGGARPGFRSRGGGQRGQSLGRSPRSLPGKTATTGAGHGSREGGAEVVGPAGPASGPGVGLSPNVAEKVTAWRKQLRGTGLVSAGGPQDTRCKLCQFQYCVIDYHCPVTHRTFDGRKKKIVEGHKASILASSSADHSKLNNALRASSDDIKLIKILLFYIERAIPRDAVRCSEDISAVYDWLHLVVESHSTREVAHALLTLADNLKPDWLRNGFDIHAWRKQLRKTQEETDVLVALKRLDAAIIYTLEDAKANELELDGGATPSNPTASSAEDAALANRQVTMPSVDSTSRARDRRAQNAIKWGYPPGTTYRDTNKGIDAICVHVADGRLVLTSMIEGRNFKYSKSQAKAFLKKIAEPSVPPAASQAPALKPASAARRISRKREHSSSTNNGRCAPRKRQRLRTCQYCRADISHKVYIRCGVCADFDICLSCFSIGVEVGAHKHNHAYYVKAHVSTPIFEADWGADEELSLLEGIKKYGFGNWDSAADVVGTKTKEQCAAHYQRVYLSSPSAPLPDPKLDPTRADAKLGGNSIDPVTGAPLALNASNHSNGTRGAKKPSRGAKKPVRSASSGSAGGSSRPRVSKGGSGGGYAAALARQVGYLAERGDFETEWDNDAEDVLADMEFRDEDTREERELKLQVLEIYNRKLDSREERKRFIHERGLLTHPEPMLPKDEQDIVDSFKVFARFHSKEDHDALIAGLLEERRLAKAVAAVEKRGQGVAQLGSA